MLPDNASIIHLYTESATTSVKIRLVNPLCSLLFCVLDVESKEGGREKEEAIYNYNGLHLILWC